MDIGGHKNMIQKKTMSPLNHVCLVVSPTVKLICTYSNQTKCSFTSLLPTSEQNLFNSDLLASRTWQYTTAFGIVFFKVSQTMLTYAETFEPGWVISRKTFQTKFYLPQKRKPFDIQYINILDKICSFMSCKFKVTRSKHICFA